jgi:hypothetical protein
MGDGRNGERMSGRDEIPWGIEKVAVPGHGTYGFQSVAGPHHTSGFDVYFHPEGMPARSPGYGRMRLVIADDLTWDVEFVKAERIPEHLVREAGGPAREWMGSQQGVLMFSLLGAAQTERKATMEKREELARALAWRRNGLELDRARPPGSNRQPHSSPEKVESARLKLEQFDAATAPRNKVLQAVIDAAYAFSHPDTRKGRTTMAEFLDDAREAIHPAEAAAPAP